MKATPSYPSIDIEVTRISFCAFDYKNELPRAMLSLGQVQAILWKRPSDLDNRK